MSDSVLTFVGADAPGRAVEGVRGPVIATVLSVHSRGGEAAARQLDADVEGAMAALRGKAAKRAANAVLNLRVQTTSPGTGFMFVTVYGDAVALR